MYFLDIVNDLDFSQLQSALNCCTPGLRNGSSLFHTIKIVLNIGKETFSKNLGPDFRKIIS